MKVEKAAQFWAAFFMNIFFEHLVGFIVATHRTCQGETVSFIHNVSQTILTDISCLTKQLRAGFFGYNKNDFQ